MATPPPQPDIPLNELLSNQVLSLAREFADREIQSINRTFDRALAAAKLIGSLAVGVLIFLGIGTYVNINRLAEAIVKAETPELVRKEFDKDRVRQTVEAILTSEARQDIEKMVAMQVSGEVANAVTAQQPEIRKMVQERTSSIIEELKPEISKIAAQTASQMTSEALSPRHVSKEQRERIKSASLGSRGWIVRVRPRDHDAEEITYAQEVGDALNYAGWNASIDPSNGGDESNTQMSVYISVENTATPAIHSTELKKVLAAAGIAAPIVEGYEMDWTTKEGSTKVPNLVVGRK